MIEDHIKKTNEETNDKKKKDNKTLHEKLINTTKTREPRTPEWRVVPAPLVALVMEIRWENFKYAKYLTNSTQQTNYDHSNLTGKDIYMCKLMRKKMRLKTCLK